MKHAALVLLACAAIAPAHARNDRLLIPVADAMRSKAVRTMVAGGPPVHFGSASAQGVDVSAGGASAHAVASPVKPDGQGRTHRPRPDDVVCFEAFGQAVQELQKGASAAGATAVVGIVSNYGGQVLDSPDTFECHIGRTRGVVDLKGQFARGAVPFRPVKAPPVAAPATAQPAHIASGFAAIEDVDAVPLVNDRGRQGYREWLAKSTPRAFAIAPSGRWQATWGLHPSDAALPRDPAERALLLCERSAGMPCTLYAVNGAVVWPRKAPE
jgi:hypothetical protein